MNCGSEQLIVRMMRTNEFTKLDNCVSGGINVIALS